MDLIEITEAALKEIVTLGHPLPPRIIVVTDNGPAMKAKEYRNFVKKKACSCMSGVRNITHRPWDVKNATTDR